MKNSSYFYGMQDAKEFEEQAYRMLDYSTDIDVIDAACHFISGVEKMKEFLLKECKEQNGIPINKTKTLLKWLKGGSK